MWRSFGYRFSKAFSQVYALMKYEGFLELPQKALVKSLHTKIDIFREQLCWSAVEQLDPSPVSS